MTIKEINLQIKNALKAQSSTPDLDSTLILEYILGLTKLDMILQEDYILSESEVLAINKCVQDRLEHTPIAYIIGYKEFYGRKFIVTKDVLIPRPETEAIIDITKNIYSHNTKPTIWEIGTGSGCIAITLKFKIPDSKIIASDISPQALQIAKNNDIILTGKQDNIVWLEGDLLTPFSTQYKKPDIIIANLPYLNQNQYQDDSILAEPDIALYSPNNGLEHYIRLLQEIKSRFTLYPDIILEINPEQTRPLKSYVQSILPRSNISIYKDLQGLDRHILIEN
ncbi:MAG: glutamine methylase of release factor 1 [Candidatus Parcubacteria bacterium]|jgi:release factor glutamine methyltransferase